MTARDSEPVKFDWVIGDSTGHVQDDRAERPTEAFGARGPSELSPGARVSEYEVQEQLGRGGMGAVYAARHVRLGVRRALKVQELKTPIEQERFGREARALAKVDSHSGVVTVHEHGLLNDDSQLGFTVMDLVEGRTLSDDLRLQGRLPIERATRLAGQLAEALAHIHAAGITHRDLKPENVLIRARDDAPVLTDFGLARDEEEERITGTGYLLGTFFYMSPEQAAGRKEVGPKSDVFSFGIVVYELLTGERPFGGTTPFEVMRRICSGDPTPIQRLRPEVPNALARLVESALAKEPDRRPTAAALVESLSAPADAAAPPLRPWAAVALGSVLILGLGTAAWWTQGASPTPEAPSFPSGGDAPQANPPQRARPGAQRVAQRRSDLRAALDLLGREGAAAPQVIRSLRACAARLGDPAFSADDRSLARGVARSSLRLLLRERTLKPELVVDLAEATADVGVRLGRDTIGARSFRALTSSVLRFSPAQIARLHCAYVRVDLPLDLHGPIAVAVIAGMPPNRLEATFLRLRHSVSNTTTAQARGRKALSAFLRDERTGRRLGPLARAHGLVLAAGIEDLPAARQLELAAEAARLDSRCFGVDALRALALARQGRLDESRAELKSTDRRLSGLPQLRSLPCWTFAHLGDRAGVRWVLSHWGGRPGAAALRAGVEQVLKRSAPR